MQLRRKLAVAACATALTAPVLSACGFNYATDEPYTPAAGTNSHEGRVDVLNAVVVAAQSDSGTFIGGLSNNDAEERTLTGLSGEGLTIELEPITIPASGFVNLDGSDLYVEGSFDAGQVLDMDAEFDNGDVISLEVPIVTSCDEFEGIDTSAEAGDETSGESEDHRYSCEYPDAEGGH